MASDVAPMILELVQDAFKRNINNNKKIKDLEAKIEKGATYVEADEYAAEVGEALASAYMEITGEMLPDGKMYYNIADRVIKPTLEESYNLASMAASKVQKSLNTDAGLGLNSVVPEINTSRVQGLVDKVSDAEMFDDIKYILEEPVINFVQYVVDDTLKANADFHAKAGLSPKIIRVAEAPHTDTYYKRGKKGKRFGPYIQILPCKWCQSLAGEYDYESVKNTGNDVFRRHERCKCQVIYLPGNGKAQNVWDKSWQDVNEVEIEERVNIADTISKAIEDSKDIKDPEYAGIKNYLDKANVQKVPVSKLENKLNEKQIIEKIAGGDETKGSCSSAALAYIGNKAGYDVRDFRGGASQEAFATNLNIRRISQMQDVTSIYEVNVHGNGYAAAHSVLKQMQEGKEYYFTAGEHAAIVKKTPEGLRYLELQQDPKMYEEEFFTILGIEAPDDYGNKFKILNDKALKDRFHVTKTHTTYGIELPVDSVAIDIETLYNNDDFIELLEYINTQESNVQTGGGGYAK